MMSFFSCIRFRLQQSETTDNRCRHSWPVSRAAQMAVRATKSLDRVPWGDENIKVVHVLPNMSRFPDVDAHPWESYNSSLRCFGKSVAVAIRRLRLCFVRATDWKDWLAAHRWVGHGNVFSQMHQLWCRSKELRTIGTRRHVH